MLPLLLPVLAFLFMFFLSSNTFLAPNVHYYTWPPTARPATPTSDNGGAASSAGAPVDDGEEEWSLESLVPVLTGAAMLAFALYGFTRQVQQQGLAGTFRPLGDLLGVFSATGPRGPQRTRSNRGPRRARSLRTKEAIEQAVRALPIETFCTRRELEEMSIAELKVCLWGGVFVGGVFVRGGVWECLCVGSVCGGL